MKSLIKVVGVLAIWTIFALPFAPANAYVSVKGYYRSNGTYVAPYVRSNPNGLKYDNYSYTPSQDLYNDTYGTRDAAWDTPTYITDPNYYEGKAIYDSGSAGYVGSTGYNTMTTKIAAPANAYVSGNTWYCNSGYKTLYDSSYNKIGCTK